MSRSGWWFGGLGPVGDAGDERDRVGEGRELEGLHDLVALTVPAAQGGEALGDAVVGEFGHAPIVDLGGPDLRVGRVEWLRGRDSNPQHRA